MYKQITMAEAKEIMSTEEEFIILDVRTQEEYADGHIPGAICVPNETIGSQPYLTLHILPHLCDKVNRF